jgi:Domain of unknown function (DUF1835)
MGYVWRWTLANPSTDSDQAQSRTRRVALAMRLLDVPVSKNLGCDGTTSATSGNREKSDIMGHMLDFDGAAHIAHGDSVAGALCQLGAETSTLQVVRDLLTYGPCDTDPARHMELRLAHWQVLPDRAGEFSLSATLSSWPSTQPIVVWAAQHAWSDQLFLWWTLDALARAHVEPSRVYWAAPVTHHRLAATGAAPSSELARALAQARPIAPELVDASRELWRCFASPSPLPFDELRRAGLSAVSDLASIAEPHGWWFPRLIDGRLRLSEMDELLLYVFDNDWRGPTALLRGMRAADITDRLFNVYGDMIVIARLTEWVGRGVLEYQRRGGVGWGEHAFRLTDVGRRLRDEGMQSVAEAPAIYTGGCRTHDPAWPFVRVVDSGGWRLALP